jgi:alcohol dehydrogenase (cytochrome c)
MYYPLQNLCMQGTSMAPDSSLYAVSTRVQLAPGTTNLGTIYAISAETGATTWKIEQRAGMLSLIATGGGLIFAGDTAGKFRAYDDRTGKVLWEQNLGSPVSGYPITFAINGKQYVAVSTGPSLVAGAANRLTPEIRPSNQNQMYVFALP